jgi:hypothetical protein
MTGRKSYPLLAYLLVCAWQGALPPAAAATPVSQIISPAPAAKLRSGQVVPVRVHVQGLPDVEWSVRRSTSIRCKREPGTG